MFFEQLLWIRYWGRQKALHPRSSHSDEKIKNRSLNTYLYSQSRSLKENKSGKGDGEVRVGREVRDGVLFETSGQGRPH